MKIKYLQVVEMPNGEVICLGKTIGFTTDKASFYKSSTKTLSDYLFSEDDFKKEKIDVKKT